MKFTDYVIAVSLLSHHILAQVISGVNLPYGVGKNKHYDYGVVIDLGSSGSRCSIFTWPEDSEEPWLDITYAPNDDHYENISPGISTFKDDPASAGAYLKPLLDFAVDKLPEKKIATTPVFIKGTAGLRSLGPVHEDILTSVYKYVTENYSFYMNESFLGTITGLQEGAYGWITINKLLGNFDKADKFQTIGTLDMGHGSTQITFVPDQIGDMPSQYQFNFTYEGQLYTIYSHSFAGYGYTQALYNANATAITGQDPSEYTNPCMLKGYTYDVLEEGSIYSVSGESDWIKCKSVTYDILNKTAPCPVTPCSFDGAYQPLLSGDFWTISNFVDVAGFYGLGKNDSPENIFAATGKFCGLTWDEAQDLYPDEDADELATYCFAGNYLASLLGNGYGFPADFKIHFEDRFDGFPVSWAMGEMIIELQRGW